MKMGERRENDRESWKIGRAIGRERVSESGRDRERKREEDRARENDGENERERKITRDGESA